MLDDGTYCGNASDLSPVPLRLMKPPEHGTLSATEPV